MDSLNWLAIFVISIVSCMAGALWFGPIFGKLWMRIHHGDKQFSAEEMKQAMRGMWKLIASEFVAIFLMIMTLDFAIRALPVFSGVHVAFMMWLGFVLPTYISATVWGGDAKKWMAPKIALSAGYRLIVLLVAGYVLDLWS